MPWDAPIAYRSGSTNGLDVALKDGASGRTLEVTAGGVAGEASVPFTGEATLTNLIETMHDADFVVIDGAVFETEYLRVPDEYTDADDIVLEAKRGNTEIELTRADIDEAEYVGEGVYVR